MVHYAYSLWYKNVFLLGNRFLSPVCVGVNGVSLQFTHTHIHKVE